MGVWQHKKIWGGLLVFGLAIYLVPTGCDPVYRYQVLSFFFDGVPPLTTGPIGFFIDPNASVSSSRVQSSRAFSRHKPNRDCDNCHTEQPQTGIPILQEPSPQLCYRCHTNYATAEKYVHGPVAVGACLFCHKSHYSKFPGLQTFAQPDLCYQCHESQEVASIVDHPTEPIDQCTRCHDPHVGSTRAFLKTYRINEPESAEQR